MGAPWVQEASTTSVATNSYTWPVEVQRRLGQRDWVLAALAHACACACACAGPPYLLQGILSCRTMLVMYGTLSSMHSSPCHYLTVTLRNSLATHASGACRTAARLATGQPGCGTFAAVTLSRSVAHHACTCLRRLRTAWPRAPQVHE